MHESELTLKDNILDFDEIPTKNFLYYDFKNIPKSSDSFLFTIQYIFAAQAHTSNTTIWMIILIAENCGNSDNILMYVACYFSHHVVAYFTFNIKAHKAFH